MLTARAGKITLIPLTLLLIATGGILLYASTQLTSPSRRPIQEYHKNWLNTPEQSGLNIQTYHGLNNQIPCLIVNPAPQLKPAKRGKIIRKQLTEKKQKLTKYGDTVGNLILLHGRMGRKEDLLPVAERFCAVGFTCIIPDLPAHGDNPLPNVTYGLSSLENTLGTKLIQELIKKGLIKEKLLCIWGLSMGGAFAIHNASQAPTTYKSMIIVSSFNTLESVLKDKFKPLPILTTPLKFITKHKNHLDIEKIKPEEWISKVTCPTLIIHGKEDVLIPAKRGKRLFNALKCDSKKWLEVDNANHDNILITPMPLYAEMATWLLDSLPIQKHPS